MRFTWLVLAVLGVPRAALAAPRTESIFSATVAYTAPRACPSAEEFKAIVVARLGFEPFAADAGDHVLVSIEEGSDALEGRLEWRDQAGHWTGDRTFTAHTTDCAELVRTMGFALAVQINLLATERAPAAAEDRPREDARETPSSAKDAAARRGASAAPPPTKDTKDGSPPRASESRRGARTVFELGIGGALALGMSPGPAGLGRLFASVARGPWMVELGGELSAKTVEHRADGAGYSQRLLLASAAGCWNPEPFGVCVLTKAGVFKVEGRDIDVPASASGAAVELGPRVRLRQRLPHGLFIAERLEALFNLTRWRVTLDQIPVWTAPPLAGTLGLDVGAVF